MTAAIVFADIAKLDAHDILEYSKDEFGYDAASQLDLRLEKLYDRLAEHPYISPIRPNIGRDVRASVVMMFVVLYRYDGVNNTVTILRILDGRRRITRTMLPPEHQS